MLHDKNAWAISNQIQRNSVGKKKKKMKLFISKQWKFPIEERKEKMSLLKIEMKWQKASGSFSVRASDKTIVRKLVESAFSSFFIFIEENDNGIPTIFIFIVWLSLSLSFFLFFNLKFWTHTKIDCPKKKVQQMKRNLSQVDKNKLTET